MTTTATEEKTVTGPVLPPEMGEAQPLVTRPEGSKMTTEQIQESYGLTDAEYSVLLRTVCKKAPREIAAFFMLFCKKRSLDPFSKQVYLWPDKTDDNGDPKPGCNWNIVAGIDGMRAIASRSPYFRGQRRPVWEYQRDEQQPDGVARFTKTDSKWGHVVGKRIPTQCEVVVLRAVPQAPADRSLDMEFYGIARFDEFKKARDGKLFGNWEEQPEHQLRVRAEAMALRMAFPEEVGSIYTPEELEDRQHQFEPGPAPEVEFSDEERALAKRAGWPDEMLKHQYKRFGTHERLLEALEKIVDRTENSGRARARNGNQGAEAAKGAAEASVEPGEPGAVVDVAPPSPGDESPAVPTFDMTPGSMTDATRAVLFGALGRRNITAKDDRIAWARELGLQSVEPKRGRPSLKDPSFKNLSESDARRGLDNLTVYQGDGVFADRVRLDRCVACDQLRGESHQTDCPIDEENIYDEPADDDGQTRLV